LVQALLAGQLLFLPELLVLLLGFAEQPLQCIVELLRGK
jgi:hypothetical protein